MTLSPNWIIGLNIELIRTKRTFSGDDSQLQCLVIINESRSFERALPWESPRHLGPFDRSRHPSECFHFSHWHSQSPESLDLKIPYEFRTLMFFKTFYTFAETATDIHSVDSEKLEWFILVRYILVCSRLRCFSISKYLRLGSSWGWQSSDLNTSETALMEEIGAWNGDLSETEPAFLVSAGPLRYKRLARIGEKT